MSTPAPRTPGPRTGRRRRPAALGPVAGRMTVSVDNNHCHLYAICQQEAPVVFDLGDDGRLRYDPTPPPAQTTAVRQAVRMCPMQAITVRERP